ncbi:hypothetical protein ACA910_000232 [Epithemia clementina (nom. ined.)]
MLSTSSFKVYVLYVDHKGHPAPLSSCYHATGARRLSSSAERYPPSTLTEVDSAYCPQCLTAHDADSAARLGFCPKASCQRCPKCQSALSVGIEGKLCFYKCGFCSWDSRGCRLTHPVNPQDDGSLSRVELARALEEFGSDLKSRREASRLSLDNHSKALTQAWQVRTKRAGNAKANTSRERDAPEGWSVEALEASLGNKKKLIMSDNLGLSSLMEMTVEHTALDSSPSPIHESLNGISQLALELQSLNDVLIKQNPRASHDELLPLPMPFRARLSRRCRAELEEGRPGILLKPKLNPMEGDSSSRTGHGQWWKKDSSAIHVMPRIGVLKHETKEDYRVFLIKVTNPTLGPVRLRFTSSSYQGETDWDDPTKKNPVIDDLIVDDLFQVHMNLELKQVLTAQMKQTESIELFSAEDSFIELGGKSTEIPDQVKNWTVDGFETGGEKESAMRLVASSASTAYFELALANAAGPATRENHAVAVPLTLQLETGNGSWESSLIQKVTEGENPDWVSFDLVITWS